MTFEEIRKEFEKDKDALQKHVVFYGKKINKLMRHTNMHHYDKFHEYNSPRKNRWVIRDIFRSQKIDDGTVTKYCCYATRNSYAVVCYSMATDRLLYYTGHFFTRFFQREELEKDIVHDLIRKYLEVNNLTTTHRLKDMGNNVWQVFGQTTTGVALGYMHTKINLLELRTFISNDMLKADQVELSKQLEEKFKLHVIRE